MKTDLLKRHAKSFYWASYFLDNKIYTKCCVLYNFCRSLDDIADKKSELEKKRENFKNFKNKFFGKDTNNEIIKDMWALILNEKISLNVVKDLFDGVETDLSERVMFKSQSELITYSYRVAGTVGLMMAKIFKIKSKNALLGAINLGVAMQLTNIARDVVEDEAINRNYINGNFSSIIETLNTADTLYKKSYFSIKEIPIRSRFSIIVARRLYQKIGNYILGKKNKENYIKAGKIYVPLYRKILETLFSLFDFIHILFMSKHKESDQLLTIEKININERI
tara:strand:- start:1052 stop:1891 length:840 start_codon:yes stop_codon:yes gene_type:complete